MNPRGRSRNLGSARHWAVIAWAAIGLTLAACAQEPAPLPSLLAEAQVATKQPAQAAVPKSTVEAPKPTMEAPAQIPQDLWAQLPPEHPALEPVANGWRVAPLVGEKAPDQGAVGEGKKVPLLPDPEYPTRQRKRMNIDQLDAALLGATGGLTWTVAGKNQFAALSTTLGKPDFADMVIEDLAPSTLFQKFLQDAALNVCEALVAKDAKAKPADRVYFVHAEPTATPAKDAAAVEKNLRYLLLRWHGRQLPQGAPQLENWRFLLAGAQKTAAAGKKPTEAAQQGWQALCVGLVTHPSFYTY